MESPDHPAEPAAENEPSPRPRRTFVRRLRRMLEAITGPWTRQNLLSWIEVVVLVLLIRWLWFEPFRVPSGSMEPTFHGDRDFWRDDRVAVNKFIYGPRVPFTNKRIFHVTEPKRWDVVVFKSVQESPEHKTLVKRIVGLPGERIRIRNGRVFVNGEPTELPDHMPDVYYVSDSDLTRLMTRVQSPEERELLKQIRGSYPLRYAVLDDDVFAIVPEDCYLTLGDNSACSVDGRYYGWVPNDHILGRVFCIWWPPARWRDFTGFTKTWWGKSIPFDMLALFVLFEVMQRRKRKRLKMQEDPGSKLSPPTDSAKEDTKPV